MMHDNDLKVIQELAKIKEIFDKIVKKLDKAHPANYLTVTQ